jgi:hypothetical protein
MTKYRKKPVVIEARQFSPDPDVNDTTDENGLTLEGWLDEEAWYDDVNETWVINTLEGAMAASVGDWIVKGVEGEFYPVKPSIFAATYEEVSA